MTLDPNLKTDQGAVIAGIDEYGDVQYFRTNVEGFLYNDDQPYSIRIDDYSESYVKYVGYANAGTQTTEALWKIKKISYTPYREISILWANGTLDFDNVWDDRLTLTYS